MTASINAVTAAVGVGDKWKVSMLIQPAQLILRIYNAHVSGIRPVFDGQSLVSTHANAVLIYIYTLIDTHIHRWMNGFMIDG
jgi:hypothetical protein